MKGKNEQGISGSHSFSTLLQLVGDGIWPVFRGVSQLRLEGFGAWGLGFI